MTTDLETAQRHWADALTDLKNTMTRATYDFSLQGSQVLAVQEGGAYQVGAPAAAVEWLANRLKLKDQIERSLAHVAGRQLDLEFVALPGLPSVLEQPTAGQQPEEDKRSYAGQIVANANYYSGFFERGGSGYAPLPHHSSFFWVPMLDTAFSLLNILTAIDRRPLNSPAHYWTPPAEYTYTELANKLNRRHPRYISGDEIECNKSREWRLRENRPLRSPAACCHSRRYDLLRYKPHPRENCLICLHWKLGLLEVLERWGLVVIELKDFGDSYKFKIQAWRMLPILTPYQCQFLTPALQDDYLLWLRNYGHLFQIPDVAFWQMITDENIVPLMPTHDQPELSHNFDQRRKRQEFLRHAVNNPYYGQNGQEEGEDDEN